MLCLNCTESRQITRCPWCQVPLQVRAVSNLASLNLDRRLPLTQPPQPNNAAPNSAVPNIPAPNNQTQNSVRQRNDDAINAILRDDGVEDPAAYRASQRRQGGNPRRRGRTYQDEGADDAGVVRGN